MCRPYGGEKVGGGLVRQPGDPALSLAPFVPRVSPVSRVRFRPPFACQRFLNLPTVCPAARPPRPSTFQLPWGCVCTLNCRVSYGTPLAPIEFVHCAIRRCLWLFGNVVSGLIIAWVYYESTVG